MQGEGKCGSASAVELVSEATGPVALTISFIARLWFGSGDHLSCSGVGRT